MSLTISPSSRLPSDRRGPVPTVGCRSTDRHNQFLTAAVLPAVDALEFFPSPAMLWSEDRTQCLVNRAMLSLLGSAEIALTMDKDLWLSRLEPLDRENLLSSWNKLLTSEENVVCRYRFLPFGGACAMELEETARRFILGSEESTAFLSCYRVGRSGRAPREPSPIRTLVHKIGNSLQAVRGEVDLLRLVGDLPQKTFDSITQNVESIHSLVAQIENLADHDRSMTHRDGAGAPSGPSKKSGEGKV